MIMLLSQDLCFQGKVARPTELDARVAAYRQTPGAISDRSWKKSRKGKTYSHQAWEQWKWDQEQAKARGDDYSSVGAYSEVSGTTVGSDFGNLRDFQDQYDRSGWQEPIAEDNEALEIATATRRLYRMVRDDRNLLVHGTSSSSSNYRAPRTGTHERRYPRHAQKSSAVRQKMFTLAGLALIVPGESVNAVAIIAPLSSGGLLVVLGKLFLF